MKYVKSFRANNISDLEESEIRDKEFLHQYTEFDEAGHPVEAITYTPDGTVEHKYKYQYNAEGKVTDELLIEEKASIDPVPIPVMPEKIKEIVQIKRFNLELFKVSRQLRLFHFIIDMAFMYFVGICTGYVLAFLIGLANVLDHQYLIGLIVVFFTYFIQEFIFGKTIGKFMTKTHVVNSSGNKPTVGQLILRNFTRIIPFEAFTFVLKGSRGFHDSISNTYVIKD